MLSVFRSQKNPFLSPSSTRAFEAIGAFNPSVVKVGDDVHVFYRAISEPDEIRTPGRGFSTIGYTCSVNGECKDEDRRMILGPSESWEAYGCEDPRATFFEDKWYLFYTALGGFPFGPDNIKVAVAISDSDKSGAFSGEFTERHLVTPFNAKAATLFPERINGEAVLILTAHTDRTDEHPFPTIALARSKNIEDFWKPEFWNNWHEHLQEHAFPDVRRADSEHIEVGATPVLTKHGWLIIYSHIQNYYDEHNRIFGVEALLLDRNDPMNVLSKTSFPFLVPEESYEKYGLVPNIVFPTGAHVDDDTLTIYYGGADTVCASATLSLSDLLESMDEKKREKFVKRLNKEPLIAPREGHDWEAGGVSNAAAFDHDGSVHLLYRAATNTNHSTMGYARLNDDMQLVERSEEPVYAPREDFESHGTEDPRLTLFEGKLYVAYTGFDGITARGVTAFIDPLDFCQKDWKWSSPIAITPENMNDKDVCLLPERVDGKIAVLHRIDPDICIDFLDEFPPTQPIDRSIQLMSPRPGMWDGLKVGAAAAPLRLSDGNWLFIYHAVGPDVVYRLGAAILDSSMTTVLSRTATPIMEPVLEWEKNGVVENIHNVVFSCGLVLRDDTLYIYYGGADTAIGVATISLKALVKKLLPAL